MQAIINAQGLSKRYGNFTALNKVNLNIYPGQFVGLIGPNGAGKTTLLKALLGLSDYEGKLDVLGLTPLTQRHLLMQKACFIADVAVLPRWMRVDNLINYVDAVHPSFSKEKMQHYLSKTDIKPKHKIKELSKGMITQVHLALVMAVDVPLLVLDEPTLGLDILYRKEFYAHLLEEYFDENRTIIVTTHQAEEIEHLLTHLMFIKGGELILDKPMDQVAEEYSELIISPEHLEAARALKPLHERKMMGRHVLLYRNPDKTTLENLGEIHIPSIADLFVALVKETNA